MVYSSKQQLLKASVYALIVIAEMISMNPSPEFMYTCPHVVDKLFKLQRRLGVRSGQEREFSKIYNHTFYPAPMGLTLGISKHLHTIMVNERIRTNRNPCQ